MRRVSRILLCVTVSVGLMLLPSALWTFAAGLHPSLLEFMGYIFTFSSVLFVGLLGLRLPDWLGNPPGLYLLNLPPILVIGLAAYMILRRSPKLSSGKAACIAANVSLLLMQALGSLMLYFFARYSGP
jgi:hypothetical protein